jgi:hypothetical protein
MAIDYDSHPRSTHIDGYDGYQPVGITLRGRIEQNIPFSIFIPYVPV